MKIKFRSSKTNSGHAWLPDWNFRSFISMHSGKCIIQLLQWKYAACFVSSRSPHFLLRWCELLVFALRKSKATSLISIFLNALPNWRECVGLSVYFRKHFFFLEIFFEKIKFLVIKVLFNWILKNYYCWCFFFFFTRISTPSTLIVYCLWN